MDVLTPGLKDRLWHNMRTDLARYVGRNMPPDLLLCPTCARWLPYDKFNVEHIVPRQALEDDPPKIKAQLSVNKRTPLTLLCNTPLRLKARGERLPKEAFNSGCNTWKGRLYDTSIRRVLNRDALTSKHRPFTNRETIGCMMATYLVMFEHFGYQIVCTPSGLVIRTQFFSPNKFLVQMPSMCQILLLGSVPELDTDDLQFWRSRLSFKYEPNRSSCMVAVRNMVAHLPCSRDPEIPIASHLPFAPSKYTLRPDFQTMFVQNGSALPGV